MADNIFDSGRSFDMRFPDKLSPRIRDQARIDSPARDNVITSVSKISDADLEDLYKLISLAKESQDPRIISNRLQELDLKYNLSGNQSLLNIFPIDPQLPTAGNVANQETITLLEFHTGARRRARTAERTLGDYFTKLNEGLESGDIVYMTHSRPCDKFDISKSPYERFKKIWEESKGNLGLLIDGGGNLKADISFLPADTRERARVFLVGSARPPNTWESGIFDRQQLQDGTQIPVDLGTINGSYANNEEYQKATNFSQKRQVANASLTPIFSPSLVIDVLENATDADLNPIDSSGKITKDENNVKKLSPEYQSLIVQYLLDFKMQDVENFIKEYEEFKKLSTEEKKKRGGVFQFSNKQKLVINVMAVLAGLELAKLPPEFIGDHHTTHSIAKSQGYVEIIANMYKSIYYFTQGKPDKAFNQLAIGGISAFSEFGWPTLAEEAIESVFPGMMGRFAGMGGYVGLFISGIQFYNEFIAKPKYSIKEFALKNELLDLERRLIENECCTTIHPDLYRKTGGQMSILLTDDEYIPVGREYNRTVQGQGESLNSIPLENGKTSVQSGPCDSNGQIPVGTQKRYIKFKSAFDVMSLEPPGQLPTAPVYIVDPREDKDPCKKKERRESERKKAIEVKPSDQEGGDIGSLDYQKDTTTSSPTFWSERQEQMAQLASQQYNMQYISDVYQFKIDAAKCKTGEIYNPSGPGGGGIPDRDGFYPIGQSGMTSGYHRIGTAIIARKIFTAVYEQEATGDPTGRDAASRREFWNGEWEVTTREYGFGVGGSGAGTGTKLRGITSFFYDPLNPPKPIEMV